jgi:hypothetical protein
MSAASCVYDGFLGNISGEAVFLRPKKLFRAAEKESILKNQKKKQRKISRKNSLRKVSGLIYLL